MELLCRSCVILLAAVSVGSTADPNGEELFRKVRTKVMDAVSHVPRYTCLQTIERKRYIPVAGRKYDNCSDVVAARKQLVSPGYLVWRDRLRLDVAFLDGTETFSWAGARRFETSHVDELAPTGATTSGEFISFLAAVFGGEPDSVSLQGLSLFDFHVPLDRSHYRYHSQGGSPMTIEYKGTFRVDPETADLKRLTVIADQFPPSEDVCRVQDAMDYHREKIGSGEFLLPQVATMDVLYKQGNESVNETRYSECREYTGESTITFNDSGVPSSSATPQTRAPRPLPAGLHFRIGLSAPIHSETAGAGDAITGVILEDVKEGSRIVARVNDVVEGRILQMEQYTFPPARWVIAIRFDTLQHDGVDQPLSLKTLNNGVFSFPQSGSLDLDQNFHSEWETR